MSDLSGKPDKQDDTMRKVELDILELKQAQKAIEEFIIETRRIAVLESHSIDYLNYQFKRVLADNFALTQSLADVEKEVAQRYASYEMAMRERARLKETVEHQHKLLNLALQQYKSAADENILLKGTIEKLNKELEAKNQIISALEHLLVEIRDLIQQRKLPPDVVAELQRLLPEVPKPLKPVEKPPPAEEEEAEEPEEESLFEFGEE